MSGPSNAQYAGLLEIMADQMQGARAEYNANTLRTAAARLRRATYLLKQNCFQFFPVQGRGQVRVCVLCRVEYPHHAPDCSIGQAVEE